MTLVTVEQYEDHILAAVSHPHGSAFRNRDKGHQHSETIIRYDNGDGQKEEGMPLENKKGLTDAPTPRWQDSAYDSNKLQCLYLKFLSVFAAQTQIERVKTSLWLFFLRTPLHCDSK